MLRKHLRTARNAECYICAALFHFAFEVLLDCWQANLLPISGFDDNPFPRTIHSQEEIACLRSTISCPHSGKVVTVGLRQM